MKDIAVDDMNAAIDAAENKRAHLVVREFANDDHMHKTVLRVTAFETLMAACMFLKGSDSQLEVTYCGCDRLFDHNEDAA